MIITIKNLQQQTFSIELEAANTVLELKEAIFKERGGEYNVERQKLIYAGVILEDERTLASYNVDDKKFVVVMLKRSSSTASAQKPENPDVRDDNAAAASSTTEAIKPLETNQPPSTASTSSTASDTTVETQTASDLLMGEEYNKSVESMVEMGYSREMVERAMAASFNNPERAVEYLISGIPEAVDVGFNASSPEAVAEINAANVRSSAATNTSNDPFEFLRDQPQFLQMRSLVYQNPDLLHAVLQQIGQTNPALLQLISDNQDAFLNMLNQPVEGQEVNSAQRLSSPERRFQLNAAAVAAASGLNTVSEQQQRAGERTSGAERTGRIVTETRAPDNEGPAIIRLTRAERDAIERLKAMGFPEALVVEAYFACDKDEQLAANFLISSAFDD